MNLTWWLSPKPQFQRVHNLIGTSVPIMHQEAFGWTISTTWVYGPT